MKSFSRGWLVLIVVLGLLRLVLSGDRDVLAVNSPHDEYWYVSSALNGVWGRRYSHMVTAHLPVYSAWLGILTGFGIPGRLAIDVAWLAASFYLAFAVRQLTSSSWVGAALFAFLAFHPYGIMIFDRALSGTLLTVLTTFTLAGFIELWNTRNGESRSRRVVAWIVTAFGFAAAYHTRKEGIVLLAPLGLLLLWSLYQWKSWWHPPGLRSLAVPMLVAPVLGTILLGVFIVGCNFLRWNAPVRSELLASGYVRALDALYAIDIGEPTPKHITLTAKTRAHAYAASPTFGELRGFLEGLGGQLWAVHTFEAMGVSGEIANGWMYWVLRDAAASAGWHKNHRFAEVKYNAVADELQRAFEVGRLQRRTVIVSYIDPDLGKWIPDLPRSFIGVLKLVVAPNSGAYDWPAENATPTQYEDFVKVFGRRRLRNNLTVEGWVTAPPGTQIGLGSGAQTFAWKMLVGPTRPDVPGGFPFQLMSEPGQRPTELHVRTPDGTIGSVAIAKLRARKVEDVQGLERSQVGIDRLYVPRTRLRGGGVTVLTRVWAAWGWLLVFAGSIGLALGLAYPRTRDRAVVMVAAIAMVAVIARVGLLSILDASSWNGLQQRYLFPAVSAFAAFGFVGIWIIVQRVARPLREAGKVRDV